jgi:predicted branched-subunit amino acid permease
MTMHQHSGRAIWPGVVQAAVFVLGVALYAVLAGMSGRPELWAIWAGIAACAGTVAYAAVSYRRAGRAKPRWFNGIAVAAFILAVVFGAVHGLR